MSLTEQDRINIINFKEILVEHNMDSVYSQLSFYIATNVIKRLTEEHCNSSDHEQESKNDTNDTNDTNDIDSINELDNKLYISPESLKKIILTINQNIKRRNQKSGKKFALYVFQYVKIIYDGDPLYIKNTIIGNKPVGNYPETFKTISIKYNNISKIIDLNDRIALYFNKFNKGIDNTFDSIDHYINEDGYWDTHSNVPTRNLSNIYLPKKDKMNIVNDLLKFVQKDTESKYMKRGIKYKRVYLLHGVPGSGKTSLVWALASKLNYDISSFVFDPKTTDITLKKLIQMLPKKSILLMEDMDCLFKERKSNDELKNGVTLSGLFNILDGISSKHGMIVFITTNYINSLYDEAFIRPGRIDYYLKFDYIKEEEVKEIYKVFMDKIYTEDMCNKFYRAYQKLNVTCSVALLQKYLFKYDNDPENAIKNIKEIKDIKRVTTMDTNKDMYM